MNDGGPAFPRPYSELGNSKCSQSEPPQEMYWDQKGMTLRDYFAGQVLGSSMKAWGYGELVMPYAKIVKTAYECADAMLLERNKREEK